MVQIRQQLLERACNSLTLGARLTWFIITLPFQILAGLLWLIGRVGGVSLGFLLMVLGVAFGAGPLFIVGIPIFLIGLLLTLRCV